MPILTLLSVSQGSALLAQKKQTAQSLERVSNAPLAVVLNALLMKTASTSAIRSVLTMERASLARLIWDALISGLITLAQMEFVLSAQLRTTVPI